MKIDHKCTYKLCESFLYIKNYKNGEETVLRFYSVCVKGSYEAMLY